jgi:hypothetical protein
LIVRVNASEVQPRDTAAEIRRAVQGLTPTI